MNVVRLRQRQRLLLQGRRLFSQTDAILHYTPSLQKSKFLGTPTNIVQKIPYNYRQHEPICVLYNSLQKRNFCERDLTKDNRAQRSCDENQEQRNSQVTGVEQCRTSECVTTNSTPKVIDPHQLQYEMKTNKGVLSITTTIEDSKINDIVMEKAPIKSLTSTSQQTKESGEAADETGQNIIVKTGGIETDGKESAAAKSKKATAAAKIVAAILKKPGVLTKDMNKSMMQDVVEAALPPPPSAEKTEKPRLRVDFNRSSLERNFITPTRAMSDFLLTSSDLEDLPKIKRRSPYEHEPPITVFWRRDVEAKSLKIWGSREALLKETLKREIDRKKHQQKIFTVKRRLRDYRREVGNRTFSYENADMGLKGKSAKVVLIAVGINAVNFIFKVGGWIFTGSHSMFAECLHSLADTINQLILVYGIHKSQQTANTQYPYGYSNMKYVSALVSGVGIFCVGAGLSIYHGIGGLISPSVVDDFFWALLILGGSLVSEGATLLVAINEVRRSAQLSGVSFFEYVKTSRDPCVNVVLLEDTAAVSSIVVAVTCMSLSSLTGSHVFDSIGSLVIGGILGSVASFLIYTNGAALVGKTIPIDRLNEINNELETDIMIRAIYDVKGIGIGQQLVRYKAELDFDGRELTRSYLDKQDLPQLLKVVQEFKTTDELEEFLLTHGENIVDLVGGEIDRIEMKLRKKFPEIRHCDLEIL